jgi:hypothetical protein
VREPHGSLYLWTARSAEDDAADVAAAPGAVDMHWLRLQPDYRAHVGLFAVQQSPFGSLSLDMFFPYAAGAGSPVATSGRDWASFREAARRGETPTGYFGQAQLDPALHRDQFLPALHVAVLGAGGTAARLVPATLVNDAPAGDRPQESKFRRNWAPVTLAAADASALYSTLWDNLPEEAVPQLGHSFVMGHCYGQKRPITSWMDMERLWSHLLTGFSTEALESVREQRSGSWGRTDADVFGLFSLWY